MRCLNCGAELAPEDHYCKHCGMSTEANLKRGDRASERNRRVIKGSALAVAVLALVVFCTFALLIFSGAVYNVLDRF